MVYTVDNPRYHVLKVRGMLNAVMRHCREDIEKGSVMSKQQVSFVGQPLPQIKSRLST